MREITFGLVGKQQRWSFTREAVRVGCDPSCDLVLPSDEYPLVSACHLRVQWEEDAYWVEDLESRNGTFLNGESIRREKLSLGDVLRLGADGPELRVQFALIPTGARTRAPATPVEAGRTKPGKEDTAAVPPTRPGVPAGPTPPTAGSAQNPTPTASEKEELSPGEEAMVEQRLNTVRNLLAATLVLVLALLGVVVYQMQQINRNYEAIQEMRGEARTAVGQFMPDFEKRLSSFESRLDEVQTAMDGMDGKIRQAENRMVNRLDQELPRILDAYIEKKFREIQQRVQPRQ